MSKDYDSMTDVELKLYMLDHRDDQEAFYKYMDRRHARPKKVLITATEAKLPFDEYMKLSAERLRSHFKELQ